MQPLIPLASLLPANFDPASCKEHCAVFNGQDYPIDVMTNYSRGMAALELLGPETNAFNRQFFFSLAQDRHDPTLWLFGGIWEVTGRCPEPRTYSYGVVPRDDLMGAFVRRLYLGCTCRAAAAPDHGVVSGRDAGVLHPRGGVRRRPIPGPRPHQPHARRLQIIVSRQRPGWRILSGAHEGRLRHPRPDDPSPVRRVGLPRHRHPAALEHLRRDTSRERRRPPGSPGREGRGAFPHEHEARVAGVMLDAHPRAHVLDRESYWREVLHARSLGHNKN